MNVPILATFAKLVQACIQEEGHNMFIFKSSLVECQGRWRDIPWGVHKSYIQVFAVFIALSEHSCTLLLTPWLCVSPDGTRSFARSKLFVIVPDKKNRNIEK